MAEDEAKKLKRELRYWRTRLATAELRPAPDGRAVAFGARVTYRLNGRTKTVAIVGDDEADPNEGRISFSSPLARAMMNAEVGELLDFGGKADAVEILSIDPIQEG
jgi:transcription elongation GreA/GreB family factor